MDTAAAEIFLQAIDVLGISKINYDGIKGDISWMGYIEKDGKCEDK